MIHEFIDNRLNIQFDYSVESSLKSFKEEVLNEVYSIYKNNNARGILLSGGNDSAFVLRSMLELGIEPKIYSYIHTRDFIGRDISLVQNLCKKYGLKDPEYIFIDENILVEHIRKLKDNNQAFRTLHIYCIDYILSKIDDNCFSGLMSEYSINDGCIRMDPFIFLLQEKNPGRVFSITNDRTFLSFLQHEIFIKKWKQVFKDEVYGHYAWGVRDMVYKDCYPDMEFVVKRTSEFKDLIHKFCEVTDSEVKNVVPRPFSLEPFSFDIEQYFLNKPLRK